MEYVAGFLVDRSEGQTRVALVKKERPEWQKGFLNGIGGHIEPDETPYDAQVREFREETGAEVATWKHFCTLYGDGHGHACAWRVYFFVSYEKALLESTTDEEILWVPIGSLQRWNGCSSVPNLHWLIPMALTGSVGLCGNMWPFSIQEIGGCG